MSSPRCVVLDTETTGLELSRGHRIIEVGCLEILHRKITGREFHCYLNPDREVDPEAVEVHGITSAFLVDKPRFAEKAQSLVDFIRGAELIIHNADFDVGFLNHELQLLGTPWGQIDQYCTVTDTLLLARKLHPRQRNNLDALCKRYNVDNQHRDLHGALLDARLLAEVYLAMTSGQATFLLSPEKTEAAHVQASHASLPVFHEKRVSLRTVLPTPEELAQHEAYLDSLDKACGKNCLWRAMPLPTSSKNL